MAGLIAHPRHAVLKDDDCDDDNSGLEKSSDGGEIEDQASASLKQGRRRQWQWLEFGARERARGRWWPQLLIEGGRS
ncbi:hypothetical protein E2562_031791 [Oryza meyeriana var. granulata]|uniref:Uncharacterized protein n=1 Tax=Oryza meyeriana var. granulata TaxID=110450 RepID=A0A6G1ECI0_9ORYZ|nr:hypothetical protein E2562_031791 [Oryza meyeriana var. granulata]